MACRYATCLSAVMIVAVLLTACWDKTETNELALVSTVGVDSDPDSGESTVYYQIINPLSATSSKGMAGGEQAPVYTYEIKGSSFGEIKSAIYQILPRKLFVAHYKVFLVSRRTARQGIRDLVNYIEIQSNGRASVPMLIVDGSMPEVMQTVTPLERVPSDSIDSRLDLLIRNSLLAGKDIRIKDVIERSEKSEIIVLPLIARMSETLSANSMETAAEVEANPHNFIVAGGAVFRNYRMVGELDDAELIWYHLLDGQRGRQVRQFQVEGKNVSVEFNLNRLRREVVWTSDQPLVKIRMDLDLSTIYASEFVPKSRNDVKKFEHRINQIIADECLAFYQRSREQGWDLLGIRDVLRRQKPNHPDIGSAAKNAKLTIQVHTRLKRIGSMNQPYEGTGGEA